MKNTLVAIVLFLSVLVGGVGALAPSTAEATSSRIYHYHYLYRFCDVGSYSIYDVYAYHDPYGNTLHYEWHFVGKCTRV